METRTQAATPSLRVRSQSEACLPPERLAQNRCEELGTALRVHSQIRAGRLVGNRCQELGCTTSLRVRSQIKAGIPGIKLAGNRCEVLATA